MLSGKCIVLLKEKRDLKSEVKTQNNQTRQTENQRTTHNLRKNVPRRKIHLTLFTKVSNYWAQCIHKKLGMNIQSNHTKEAPHRYTLLGSHQTYDR